ncbi:hypothetical protein AB1Y20_010777 [Prymnesium parvum]|uniref:Uncharacterized protein n=1 Tax=Prymnesium parvum TaxID=97485 RepID=A0AB34ISG5_PRYPA
MCGGPTRAGCAAAEDSRIRGSLEWRSPHPGCASVWMWRCSANKPKRFVSGRSIRWPPAPGCAGWCCPRPPSSAPAGAAVLDAQTALVVPTALEAQAVLVVPAPAAMDAQTAVVVATRTHRQHLPAPRVVPCGAVVLHRDAVQPTPRAAASAAAAAGSASRVAVLDGEESDIARAVDEFLSVRWCRATCSCAATARCLTMTESLRDVSTY